MKKVLGSLAGGVAGVALGVAGVRLWRGREGGQDDAVPLYMPNELLLTLHQAPGAAGAALTHEDGRVQTLLRRASGAAGGHGLHLIHAALPGDEAARDADLPLTLRLHVPPPHGRLQGLPRRHHVKGAADRINRALDAMQHRGVAVSSAMPNWLVSCSGGGGGPHFGPGVVPDPAPPGDWVFVVPPAGAWPPENAPAEMPPDRRVIVAVLDTSPGWQEVHRAAERPVYAANRLLQSVAAERDQRVMTYSERFTPPDDVPAHPRFNSSPDHGLFVSGIIHGIAPHAEIHLLHILDERGSGRTDLLLNALDECLRLARSGRRVVVNLSLFLMVPPAGAPMPADALWRHWFGHADSLLAANAPQKAALLAPLHSALQGRIDLLLDAGAVVVAAAGNDALAYRQHPQPRLPADYDGVLCVVAADRAGRIASYSNRGDVPPTGNCVATFGGQGALEGGGVAVPPGPDPRDGVVGLYAHHEVPAIDGPRPNASGWVYWSGTSFATPIISAIAANLLARNELERLADPAARRLTPRAVMNGILAMAEPPQDTDPALGCPYVRVTQQK